MRFFVQISPYALIDDVIPRYYGGMWRVPNKYAEWCCPVPFNLVFRFFRGVWLWLRFPMSLFARTHEIIYWKQRSEEMERRFEDVHASFASYRDNDVRAGLARYRKEHQNDAVTNSQTA